MAEKCVDRLQRLINEKQQEDMAARQTVKAQAAAAKLAVLATQDVDTEIQMLDTEMNSLTDAELKSRDKDYLYEKLAKAQELEEEKKRRGGG